MSNTLVGSTFALARWYGPITDINGADGDFRREEILGEVYRASRVGVSADKKVIAETPVGACIIECRELAGCKIVTFDFVRNDQWSRERFWMNRSSVADLGGVLRKTPRTSFDAIFVGSKEA